ncbi:MAG TPA: 6-pyruvoyl-tetrahydropterin synthase-related protein [Acidimicrobiales bacterium]|nr:6-pyruvoyl-tetrahydropterin synthase-related protein [Acidimicrobiales bacterium]
MPETPTYGRGGALLDQRDDADGDSGHDPSGRERRRPSLTSVVTWVIVVVAGFYILLQLQPGLIAANTTAAGGDMGAHVWAPAYLRDHLLPHGRITGWTPDWYAGFPALHFYFPLPSLLIVALDLLLPYGIAFKVVTVLGLVTLPAAAAALGRQLRLPFPTPALLAVSTVPFAFDRFHTIWGGNAAATLAGEFSFSISLTLALFFLAALARSLETGRGRSLASVLFGATALCHLLPAAFAVGAAGVLLATRRPDKARWGIVVIVGALGAAVAAFWFVPFIGRLPFSNDMGWERTYDYVHNLFPWLRTDDAATDVVTRHLKFVFPVAAFGAIAGIARGRRGVVVLTGIALMSAAAFRFVPKGAIWNARFLPFWYLAVYLLCAVGIAEISLLLRDAFARFEPAPTFDPDDPQRIPIPERIGPGPAPYVAALGGLLCAIVLTGLPLGVFASGRIELPGQASIPFVEKDIVDSSFVPAWARWNYSGYERKDSYPEYRELVSTMDDIGKSEGCGRAMWEYEPELNRLGTPMGLMLLPYFTDGCIGSMEGLFFESSATVPYHFLNQSELSRTPSRAMRDLPYRDLDVSKGVEHLQLLGVKYYLAISPEAQAQAAQNPDLSLITTTSGASVNYPDGTKTRSWQVYEVADSELVSPLSFEPVVVESGVDTKQGWLDAAVAWYQDAERRDIPLATGGPKEWARIADPSRSVPPTAVRPARVSGIRSDDDGISFDVDRPGTPVVVRMSYFPNWKAKGAEGPWRITPNLMVVVPTSTHVDLHYGWTGLDLGAWAITLLSFVVLVWLARRGAVELPQPPPPPPAEHVDPFVVAGPGLPERHGADVLEQATTP